MVQCALLNLPVILLGSIITGLYSYIIDTLFFQLLFLIYNMQMLNHVNTNYNWNCGTTAGGLV